jgi:hypothetical protein
MIASPLRALIPGLCSAVLLLVMLPGCAEFNVRDKMPAWMGKTGEFRRPMRVVAIWTDTVLNTPGQPSIRGFGARLMFYEDKKEKPIKVSGTLTVYAFDEAGRAKTDARPDRKYVFNADQLEKRYSKSELGHSYSVWIPWDPVGGEAKEISLIVRFVPVEGGVVISEQVKQFLPGVKPGSQMAHGGRAAPNSDPVRVAPVQLVQHQEFIDPQPNMQPPVNPAQQEPRMSTTTIPIPFGSGGRTPTAFMRERPMRPSLHPPFDGQPAAPNAPLGAGARGAVNWAPTPPQAAQAAPASSPPAGVPTTSSLAERSPTPAGKSWIAHYAQKRSRALGEPIAPLTRDRGPLRPSPAIRPSAPPIAPLPTTTLGSAPSGPVTPQ